MQCHPSPPPHPAELRSWESSLTVEQLQGQVEELKSKVRACVCVCGGVLFICRLLKPQQLQGQVDYSSGRAAAGTHNLLHPIYTHNLLTSRRTRKLPSWRE